MRYSVKVKTGAREARVTQIDDTHFEVAVKERPVEGRANEAVIAALAKHFRCAKSRIEIVSGHGSRNKIVDIT